MTAVKKRAWGLDYISSMGIAKDDMGRRFDGWGSKADIRRTVAHSPGP